MTVLGWHRDGAGEPQSEQWVKKNDPLWSVGGFVCHCRFELDFLFGIQMYNQKLSSRFGLQKIWDCEEAASGGGKSSGRNSGVGMVVSDGERGGGSGDAMVE